MQIIHTKLSRSLPILALVTLLAQSCQKNPGGNGNGNGNGTGNTSGQKCLLVKENVTGGPGYVGYYDYHYDDKGMLTSAYRLDNSGQESWKALEVQGNIVGYGSAPSLLVTHSYVGNLPAGFVSSGWVDVTDDGTTTPKVSQYIFSYTADSSLSTVTQPYSSLVIKYDANHNVSSMEVGVNGQGNVFVATMEDYDDKPNPFVGQGRYWKFIQHMFNWDYPADYLCVAACSKNNPGKITMKESDGAGGYTTTIRTIQRNYTADGLTQAIAVTDTDSKGKVTTYQTATFEYDCK